MYILTSSRVWVDIRAQLREADHFSKEPKPRKNYFLGPESISELEGAGARSSEPDHFSEESKPRKNDLLELEAISGFSSDFDFGPSISPFPLFSCSLFSSFLLLLPKNDLSWSKNHIFDGALAWKMLYQNGSCFKPKSASQIILNT